MAPNTMRWAPGIGYMRDGTEAGARCGIHAAGKECADFVRVAALSFRAYRDGRFPCASQKLDARWKRQRERRKRAFSRSGRRPA